MVLVLGMIATWAGGQGATMPPDHGSATQPASRPSSQPASEYGRYAPLVADLKLSDDQKAKVKEKVAAYNAASKEPSEKIASLHQESFVAYKAGDMEKARKLFTAIAEQNKKIGELTNKTDNEFLALLTPDQKVKLHTSGLRRMEGMTLMKIKTKFTDEQEKKFQSICEEYGKDAAGLKETGDPKAASELFNEAHKKFLALLTPEQKEQLDKWTKAATQPSGHGHGAMGGMMGN
jgi:Spy/CpxP family protein refolding chaperone